MKFARRIAALVTVIKILLPYAFAEAGPTLELGRPISDSGLRNPTDSRVLADTETDKVFWVLPPQEGSVALANFRTSGINSRFCPQMVRLAEKSRALLTAINQSISEFAGSSDPLPPKRQQRINDLRILLADTTRQLTEEYRVFARLEGGFGDVVYHTRWDENMKALRAGNPGGEFRKIPLRAVSFDTGVEPTSDLESYLATVPAVLSYRLADQEMLPYGPRSLVADSKLPDMFPMTLKLSVVGACPIILPSDYTTPSTMGAIPYFPLRATYQYTVGIEGRLDYRYNLVKLYTWVRDGVAREEGEFLEEDMDKGSPPSGTIEPLWGQSDPLGRIPEFERARIELLIRRQLQHKLIELMGVPWATIFGTKYHFKSRPGSPNSERYEKEFLAAYSHPEIAMLTMIVQNLQTGQIDFPREAPSGPVK